MRAEGLDLAVAQDGDADRLGVLDAQGRFVSPHQVLALLLLHVFRNRGERGGIAKTFSTSFQVDRIAARARRAADRDRRSASSTSPSCMNRGEAVAGGEESGGYAFAFHLPERDGVLSALLLVESLATTGRDLDQALDALAARVRPLRVRPARRLPARRPDPPLRRRRARRRRPAAVAGEAVTAVQDRDGVKYVFGERGWLLHRLSGTEPMVRLYCEHADGAKMEEILDEARGGGCEAFAGTAA